MKGMMNSTRPNILVLMSDQHHAGLERKLQAAWIHRTHPPEPDPLWFQEPPENNVDRFRQPSESTES
jgi:hypothetical protein